MEMIWMKNDLGPHCDLTGVSLDWGKSYPKWSDRRAVNYLTEICSLHMGAGHDF